jgi:hypothetical protein
MKTKTLLLTTAMAFAVPAMTMTASADVLSIGKNAKVMTRADAPKPGMSMQAVARKFGPAKHVKTSKGKVTKRNPKITRWDYNKLSVYFENSHVIHSVVHK